MRSCHVKRGDERVGAVGWEGSWKKKRRKKDWEKKREEERGRGDINGKGREKRMGGEKGYILVFIKLVYDKINNKVKRSFDKC